MSYDMRLVYTTGEKKGETVILKNPFIKRAGTVRAVMDSDGTLVPAVECEADLNITYNYSNYFYEAAEDDERFYRMDPDSNQVENAGIRGINGKTPREAVSMLMDMCDRIRERYQENGEWKTSERTKAVYYDQHGKEIDFLNVLGRDAPYTKKEIVYYVDEGDTNNYWEKTALNAITALRQMIYISADGLLEDCVWEVE